MSEKDLKPGQSILTSVRKINKVANDPTQGTILQVELAEVLQEKSLLSTFLPNDPRIIKPKPQRAWSGIEPQVFQELFKVSDEVMQRINQLPVSTGVKELQEGVHKISVNILNPTVGGKQLRVQVIETTEKPSDRATAKVNPSTGVVMTHGGQPIYRTTSIGFTADNIFLESDKVVQPTKTVITPNPEVSKAFEAASN